jgi:hypothetical protein
VGIIGGVSEYVHYFGVEKRLGVCEEQISCVNERLCCESDLHQSVIVCASTFDRPTDSFLRPLTNSLPALTAPSGDGKKKSLCVNERLLNKKSARS